MSFEKRIVPVSSGKGGVGKTTIALNYALSLARYGRTVLIDLDTGTSSLRTCIDTPVPRDLYHFFKKGVPLGDCVTPLDGRLDPSGLYRNFGFVASPKHLIEDITNFAQPRREQLIDAINALPASFVVLDLKAGLDPSVIEFLPYSNSGILIFTPHHPAATLAAADIVKAILFRKLRVLFAPGSPVYADLGGLTPRLVNDLIDRVEDVYDSAVHNLDAFVADLHHALGDHPVFKAVAAAVDSFVVHYVLNRFDGVKSSYDTAVKPFVESLAENVSAHMTILNLGWVPESAKINESSMKRIPALLGQETKSRTPAPGAALSELQRLAALHLSRRTPRPEKPKLLPPGAKAVTTPYLEAQLEGLKRMYDDTKGADFRENFAYLTARSLHVLKARRSSDFGDTRLFKTWELQDALRTRGR
jgi:MinD-like ATPase involved in chromosome partitioning or flagellar assembly